MSASCGLKRQGSAERLEVVVSEALPSRRSELATDPSLYLKHSVASWFAMEKVPIDQAADWLATDPRTLRRVYRKFDPTYLRAVASALDL